MATDHFISQNECAIFPGNIILKQILQLTSSSVIFAFSQFCQAILVSSRSCVAVSTHVEECSRILKSAAVPFGISRDLNKTNQVGELQNLFLETHPASCGMHFQRSVL